MSAVERCIEILKNTDGSIAGPILANMLGISKNTMGYVIMQAREIVAEEGLYIRANRRVGFYITDDKNGKSEKLEKERQDFEDSRSYVPHHKGDPLLTALRITHEHGHGEYPGYRSLEEKLCHQS